LLTVLIKAVSSRCCDCWLDLIAPRIDTKRRIVVSKKTAIIATVFSLNSPLHKKTGQ